MAGREHESITPQPVRITRIVLHHLLEQQVCGGGEGHRGARMAVARILDGISREGPQIPHGIIVGGGPGQGLKIVDRHRMTLVNRRVPLALPRVGRLTP